MSHYISISIAASIIGVCSKTLRRWDAAGIFKPAFRTMGNHRRYDLVHVKSFQKQHVSDHTMNSPRRVNDIRPRVVLYSRVSTSKRKKRGDLTRQEQRLHQYCGSNNLKVVRSFRDVGSDLNDSRAGLHRLIKFVSLGSCDLVLVSYSDRLARFGTRILKACFSTYGVDLKFIGNPNGKLGDSKEATLVNDITAILYSYMGKLYRMRRGKSDVT